MLLDDIKFNYIPVARRVTHMVDTGRSVEAIKTEVNKLLDLPHDASVDVFRVSSGSISQVAVYLYLEGEKPFRLQLVNEKV